MRTIILATAAYLAAGVGVTAVLSQTPYADNPWWLTTLLWPLFTPLVIDVVIVVAAALAIWLTR